MYKPLRIALKWYIYAALVFLSGYLIYIVIDDFRFLRQLESFGDAVDFMRVELLYLLGYFAAFTIYFWLLAVVISFVWLKSRSKGFTAKLFLPVVMLYLFSCSSSTADTEAKRKDSVAAIVPNRLVVKASDTVVINEPAALFYFPDSLQIEKMQKEIGEETFQAGADDYAYYMHLSDEYLEGKKLKIVSVEGNKLLNFKSAPGNTGLIRTDTLPERWGIFLFHPGSQPHFADMTDIEPEYKRYFGKE